MLLLTMVYVTIFAFLKPYRSFYINVLEVFTLVDIMLQLTMTSTDRFTVTTVYCKSFTMEKFCDFHGSISNRETFPVK